MSMDPHPRNPRRVRPQLVSRTERATPAVNRPAPASKPRLNRSLRDRDRFTRAYASRRFMGPGEGLRRPSVTLRAVPHTFSRASGAVPWLESLTVGGTVTRVAIAAVLGTPETFDRDLDYLET